MKELVKLAKKLLKTDERITTKLVNLDVNLQQDIMYEIFEATKNYDSPPNAALLKIKDVLPHMLVRLGYLKSAPGIYVVESHVDFLKMLQSNDIMFDRRIITDKEVGLFENDNGIATSESGRWWKVNETLIRWLKKRNSHGMMIIKIGKLLKQFLKTKKRETQQQIRKLIVRLEKSNGEKLKLLRKTANNVFAKSK